MARKDDIFLSFINHELIEKEYKVANFDLPQNLQEGLNSKHTIIKTIALIVQDTEAQNSSSDKALYTSITQFLNVAVS